MKKGGKERRKCQMHGGKYEEQSKEGMNKRTKGCIEEMMKERNKGKKSRTKESRKARRNKGQNG